MSDTEILIKGELHTSHGDLEEERTLIKDGVDHLIFEGPEQGNWQFRWSQIWFGWVLIIFEFLFARSLYVDKTIIKDLAEFQDVEPQSTRESNASILENAHILVKIASAGLFFVLFATALVVGRLGHVLQGSLWLLVSSLFPLLLVRSHESRRGTVGRDIRIAEMIEKAAEDGGRVVAIVGADHVNGIERALPDDVEAEVRSPVYNRISLQHLNDLFYPTLVSFSVLYVIYSAMLVAVSLFV